MIDLHTHILPGIDDGSPDLPTSVEMARASAADGILLMIATPHVNGRYMPDSATIMAGVAELNEALTAERVPVVISPGAEIAVTEVRELDGKALTSLALGGSSTVLIESPYVNGVPYLEEILFGVQARGFQVLLAHPERSPMFQDRLDVLERLVDRGILCSVTAGSLRGRFGRTVRGYAIAMLKRGLVHNVSSDSHDLSGRPPGLSSGFEGVARSWPAAATLAPWLTEAVPKAVLEGRELPSAPVPAGGDVPSRKGIRRLLGR